jgi:N-acetylglutamate synthase-like GNAT family acetyltransferase
VTLTWALADREDAKVALQAAGLPTDDVTDRDVSLYAFVKDGHPVGYGGLEHFGPDVLLRSIVVLPNFQGRGVGQSAVAALLKMAEEAGAARAYLLTTNASSYFERLGFVSIQREEAPQAIRESRQMASICASSARLMSRDVR